MFHLHLGEFEEGVEVDVAVKHIHLPAVKIPGSTPTHEKQLSLFISDLWTV